MLKKTKELVEQEGKQCLIISGNLKNIKFCESAIIKCVKTLGTLNVIVNNAAVQFPAENFEKLTAKHLHTTFETNIYPYFYITKFALEYLNEGDCIINTSSVTAYRGSEHLVDYASTKGAIVSLLNPCPLCSAKEKYG